ncbi:DUF6953 family protein [Paenibacillus sp. JJ1722]|uniref:DUF6953 family protein n=1 Tax=Paenibacillus sp. JJ1722 TaxID=3398770 RepID=UPI003AABB314
MGGKFIYINDNGNKAIKKVTTAFRKINHENKVDWDQYDFKWVLKLNDDEAEDLISRF